MTSAISPNQDIGPLPTLASLLSMGGDTRIVRDPPSGANQYGCPPRPVCLPAYGSSTASTISPSAFAALRALHQRLSIAGADSARPVGRGLALEFDRLRSELADLCALGAPEKTGIIFAASGTDIHLIATQLAANDRSDDGSAQSPLLVVMAESTETGNGVPAALRGHHPSERAAMAGAVRSGVPLAGVKRVEVVEVPSRTQDGSAISATTISEHVEVLVTRALSAEQRVLLVVDDVSKTGLLAPTPACALDLLRRFPAKVDILIDACQFRLAPSTLHSYLGHGFLVALTGSKFVTGPAFSGALLVPQGLASQWRNRRLPGSLAEYSACADWPQGWTARKDLPHTANIGLLFRWEAALAELKSFHALAESEVTAFLRAFASAVQARIAGDPAFDPLDVPPLDRGPVVASGTWDSVPTIFPFLLRRPEYLSSEETVMVYKKLLARHGQLGQPVRCGLRQGRPVSALRLCASMRLAVDALSPQGRGCDTVIAEAIEILDKTALLSKNPGPI